MTLFSRRTVLMALLLVILLSVVVRYPMVEHERYQADSYFIHLLSQSIVENGYAKWIFSPLSYFGYYPLSYPSGVPMISAELSILSDTGVEFAVLLEGVVIGTFLVMVVFCLAREFMRRPQYAILATFFAALGPRFVDTTYWVGSARGLAVVLLVLSILILYRASMIRSSPLLLVGGVIIFGTIASHHMAILFILVGIAYVVAVFSGDYLVRVFRLRRRMFLGLFFLCLTTGIVAMQFVLIPSLSDPLIRLAESDYLLEFEPIVISAVLNLAASYTHQMGFIIVFAAFFIPVFFRFHPLSGRSLMLSSIVVAFLPLIGNTLYISMVLLPFASILGTYWFVHVFERRQNRRRLWRTVLIFLILVSTLLPFASTHFWNSNSYVSGETVEVDMQLFNDGNYMKSSLPDWYCVSNSDILSMQLAASSSGRFLRNGPSSAVNDDVSRENLRDNVTSSLEGFPHSMYSWLEFENDMLLYSAGRGLMSYGIAFLFLSSDSGEFALEHFRERQNLLVVVDNDIPEQMSTRYSVIPSQLMIEVRECRWYGGPPQDREENELPCYLAYISEGCSIYLLHLPL